MRSNLMLASAVAAAWLLLPACAPRPYAYYAPPPPPPVAVVVPAAPGPGYVWIEGYWDWRGGSRCWVPGRWVLPPRPRAVWAPGHYAAGRRGSVWRPGHWRY
jgi:hypothetical protein